MCGFQAEIREAASLVKATPLATPVLEQGNERLLRGDQRSRKPLVSYGSLGACPAGAATSTGGHMAPNASSIATTRESFAR